MFSIFPAFYIFYFVMQFSIFLNGSNKVLDRGSDTPFDVYFESSDFMKNTFYKHPEKLAVYNKNMDSCGAWFGVNSSFRVNRDGKWFIEEQRYAADAVIAGIIQKDTSAINRGFKALDWGISMQKSDGSFDCPDQFHSTSFFVEAVAHSCLIMENSVYHQLYEKKIRDYKNEILLSALWMIRPDILEKGIQHNLPYTHRRYLVAAALGETGILCKNENLIKYSESMIDDGLSLQSIQGYNPEKGGYDCSYHAVGLIFAHRYYDWVKPRRIDKKRSF